MKTIHLLSILIIIALISCKNDCYMIKDFHGIKKFDAHFHIYGEKNSAIEQANQDNFKLLCINTYSGGCDRVKKAHSWLDSLKNLYPGILEYTATFCLDGWDEAEWTDKTISWLDSCIGERAIAVKVWKNIGMEFRDRDSNLVMIDNPRFDPVFKHLTEKGIPVAGHLGEPRNCWLPLDQMTTRNDSNYFSRNPQYHMFLHPDMPSYEEQMAARDRMLEKNPEMVFIGCHLGSLEWSVDELAEFFERFPNTAVDMSARMGQLFYQTRDDRAKVRRFFMNYHDRLLYGTDIIDSGQGNAETFRKRLHDTWLRDWEYLVTDNEMTSDLIEGNFRGLKLPKEVIDKIYYSNTLKWYKLVGD